MARSERVELSVDADSGVFIASEDKRSSETIFVFQRVNRQTEQPMLGGAGNALTWESTFRLVQASTGRVLTLAGETSHLMQSTAASPGQIASGAPRTALSVSSLSDTAHVSVGGPLTSLGLTVTGTGTETAAADEDTLASTRDNTAAVSPPPITVQRGSFRQRSMGGLLQPGGLQPTDAGVPVKLVKPESCSPEASMFALEPQYEATSPTIGFDQHFFLRHVATGRYLHLKEGDSSTDGEHAVMVASATKYNEDVFACERVEHDTYADLQYTRKMKRRLHVYLEQLLATSRVPDNTVFKQVIRIVSDLIIFVSTNTPNLDAMTREGLPHCARQHLLREQFLIDIRCACHPISPVLSMQLRCSFLQARRVGNVRVVVLGLEVIICIPTEVVPSPTLRVCRVLNAMQMQYRVRGCTVQLRCLRRGESGQHGTLAPNPVPRMSPLHALHLARTARKRYESIICCPVC